MAASLRFIPLFVLLYAVAASGKTSENEPHIGYIYPAGGGQGTTVRIVAGGQFLRGATEVFVSGEGVRGKVVQFYRPMGNINREEAQLLRGRINEVRDKRLTEMGRPIPPPRATREPPQVERPLPTEANQPGKQKPQEARMPEHPLLYDLENKSLREIVHITTVLFSDRKKQQQNRQLGEMVLIEITIDPNAQPGNRELRLMTAGGLTNPVVFQVGLFTEVRELEPNNEGANTRIPAMPNLPMVEPVDLPVTLNGQILPGDVDRFRFRAKRGQNLVVEAYARSLIPFLPDAVPGWFQATLTLYDAKGKEVAFADDYRFNPDPVLFYRIPQDGQYEIEIRDAIYRGREDFVYRITVGTQPFITSIFPLGGRQGVKTLASVSGWNLSIGKLPLDTQPGDDGIRHTAWHVGKRASNSIAYAVDTLPEYEELETNNTIAGAQEVNLPVIVNGRISKAEDIDVFTFKGRAGDELVAQVYARRLNSPLDSYVSLTDASGNVLASNDDYVVKEGYLYKDATGINTQQADSYLSAKLPADGMYYVYLFDAQHHGGEAYGYRLRISHPMPDFALRMTPSSLSVRPGGSVAISVHVLRKDGFSGPVEVVLKDAPAGWRLDGARVLEGRDSANMTIAAPDTLSDKPMILQMEGRATIGSQVVARKVVPSEDMMQAFLYRHLVPSQQLVVAMRKGGGRMPPLRMEGTLPVRIAAGSETEVVLRLPARRAIPDIQVELSDAPDGITLHDANSIPGGVTFWLRADKKLQAGFKDNVIVEMFREFTPPQREGAPAPQKQRNSLGTLPAIQIEIVKK
jgi:hypothetical protein